MEEKYVRRLERLVECIRRAGDQFKVEVVTWDQWKVHGIYDEVMGVIMLEEVDVGFSIIRSREFGRMIMEFSNGSGFGFGVEELMERNNPIGKLVRYKIEQYFGIREGDWEKLVGWEEWPGGRFVRREVWNVHRYDIRHEVISAEVMGDNIDAYIEWRIRGGVDSEGGVRGDVVFSN
jgi:hypothetical protein